MIWRQLEHPFVLRFIGIDAHTFRDTNNVAMVMPWRDRGTLKDYMRTNHYQHNTDSYRLVSIWKHVQELMQRAKPRADERNSRWSYVFAWPWGGPR
jgi:serine/threonine protein kinase